MIHRISFLQENYMDYRGKATDRCRIEYRKMRGLICGICVFYGYQRSIREKSTPFSETVSMPAVGKARSPLSEPGLK